MSLALDILLDPVPRPVAGEAGRRLSWLVVFPPGADCPSDAGLTTNSPLSFTSFLPFALTFS
jgi:hypothetical protein